MHQQLIDASPSDWKSLTHRMAWWYRFGAPSNRFPEIARTFGVGPGTTYEEWLDIRYEVTLKRRAKTARLTRAARTAKKQERRDYMREYMAEYRGKRRLRERANGAS